jgi:iron complex transport system substrate-binding protein
MFVFLRRFADLSKEKMVELNPNILIVPSWSYDAKQDPAQFAAAIKNDPALANINAVQNNRIYALPEKHLSCTSQYIVLGVEDLARAAYPQLFQ